MDQPSEAQRNPGDSTDTGWILGWLSLARTSQRYRQDSAEGTEGIALPDLASNLACVRLSGCEGVWRGGLVSVLFVVWWLLLVLSLLSLVVVVLVVSRIPRR